MCPCVRFNILKLLTVDFLTHKNGDFRKFNLMYKRHFWKDIQESGNAVCL